MQLFTSKHWSVILPVANLCKCLATVKVEIVKSPSISFFFLPFTFPHPSACSTLQLVPELSVLSCPRNVNLNKLRRVSSKLRNTYMFWILIHRCLCLSPFHQIFWCSRCRQSMGGWIEQLATQRKLLFDYYLARFFTLQPLPIVTQVAYQITLLLSVPFTELLPLWRITNR